MELTSNMSGEELLQLAEERMFSLGLRDLASLLSYENMKYALGKMIYALDNDAVSCVFAPDATITRNRGRWLSGFGYGSVIKWPDENVAFPEMRPNGCGMLLMRLKQSPLKKKFIENASKIEERELYLEGVKIKPDFGKGNHFFEFYKPLEISEEEEDILPPNSIFAILHCSAPELKEDVYSYADKAKKTKTPLGPISMLEGEVAKEYFESWKRLESFAKKRRELLAEKVVGDFDVISNLTHQGLFSTNEIRLGCYDTMVQGGEELFPITLRWDLPANIFRGKRNLSDEVIGRLGFKDKVEKVGLKDSLKKVNILPHGGGYEVGLSYTKIDVKTSDFGNIFILSNPEPAPEVWEVSDEKSLSEFGKMTITNPRELPYTYRGSEVIEKTIELDLGQPVAKLQPVLTLKI